MRVIVIVVGATLLIGGLCPCFAQEDPGSAPPKTTAAVLPLEANGLSEEDGRTLSNRLITELFAIDAFEIREQERLYDILKEEGLQQSGACNTDACLRQVGQVIGVQKMVAGSVGKIGKMYTVNVRVLDVKTGRVDCNVVEDFNGPIDKLLTEVVKKVAGKLSLALRAPGLPVTAAKGGSILSRWWFWGGIGAAAAGGTAAVLLKKKDKPASSAPATLDTPPAHPAQ